MFIEADPQYKKVNLYDSQFKLVAMSAKTHKEDMTSDKKKELKQEVKPDKEKLEKKNIKSLLPKKRESHKKGLSLT